MDFQLDTGLILNCIIGDVKSSGDPNYSEWGHLYPPNSISVIESVVEYSNGILAMLTPERRDASRNGLETSFSR